MREHGLLHRPRQGERQGQPVQERHDGQEVDEPSGVSARMGAKLRDDRCALNELRHTTLLYCYAECMMVI